MRNTAKLCEKKTRIMPETKSVVKIPGRFNKKQAKTQKKKKKKKKKGKRKTKKPIQTNK